MLKNQKTHTEKTAAADKAIGFDYQYYYFLYRVLKLGKNESVGLEVKDDVHTELNNNRQILIQLKHTVQKNKDGYPINLSNFDSDLWKALSNWSKVITDKEDGRCQISSQLAFIKKTDFMLVANKSYTKSCRFFTIIEDTNSARQELEKLIKETSDLTIQKYIKDVLNLSDAVLVEFLRHVLVEHGMNEIIQRCKDAIIEHHVKDGAVEQLFSDLDSRIRQDNFIAIRSGEKITISFDDFRAKYRRYFDIARNPHLKIYKGYQKLPANIKSQTFIKQLVDIEDTEENNEEEIIEYTRFMLDTKNSLDSWLQKGDLTTEEIDNFNNEARIRWRNNFKSIYKNKNMAVKELAQDLIGKLREEKMSIGIHSQQMGTAFSNGEYYYLSDIPEIGWLKDWEVTYK